MRFIILFLLSQITYFINLTGQINKITDRNFDLDFSDIHLFRFHEDGYYKVSNDFLFSYDDRAILQGIDSSIHISSYSEGDTNVITKQYYKISENNRLESVEFNTYFESGNTTMRKAEYFYELNNEGLILYDTTYVLLPNQTWQYTGCREIHIDFQGRITGTILQNYENQTWVNNSKYIWEFNEFGCLTSDLYYKWSDFDYYLTRARIYECLENLRKSEVLIRYEDLGTVEKVTHRVEYEYNDSERIIKEIIFKPNFDDNTIFELRELNEYTYNGANLNDSIFFKVWNQGSQDFKTTNLTVMIYDEIANLIKSTSYRFDEFNNQILVSQRDNDFNNSYLKHEILDGNVMGGDHKSMLLKRTNSNAEFTNNVVTYYYSGKTVSNKEIVKMIHFEVYPNPTSGELNIKFPDLVIPNSNIIVRNSTGAVVMSQIADGVNNMNVGHLPSGMYFISVKGSDLRSEVKKFTKL